MHDVRIALDGKKLFHLHRAVLAHAAQVIAPQIHEHDVFGALFGVGAEFGFEAQVFFFVAAARTRSGDGPVEDVAALHLDEHFRGAANDGNVSEAQKKHVRRGIQRAQGAIDLKRVRLRARGKTLAQDHLKDVAGADVLFRFAHRSEIFMVTEIRLDAERACAPLLAQGARTVIEGFLQGLSSGRDFLDGGVIFRLKAARAIGVHVADYPDALQNVVEGDDAKIERHHGVVLADVVAQALGQPLDQPHHVVGEVADSSAHQRRQAGDAHQAISRQAIAQELDGVPLFPKQAALAFENTGIVGVAEGFAGVCAHKGIARDFLTAFDALQQEGVAGAAGQLQVGGNRREQVRRERIAHRNEIALAGQLAEGLEIRLDHRRTWA